MLARTTIPEIWAANVRHAAAQPFVTFYDDATGERIELSRASMDNWVNKTSNLLVEELDAEPGDALAVALPPHWQGVVFVMAAWTVGLSVASGLDPSADVQVVSVELLAAATGSTRLVACSLRPLGGRIVEPLPDGCVDFGLAAPGQSDFFVPATAPDPTSPAVRLNGSLLTHYDVLSVPPALAAGGRVLTNGDPVSPDGLRLLLDVLVTGSSLVLVRNLDPVTVDAKTAQERTTFSRIQPSR